VKQPRGRPFQPGNKFGRGRPKGSRNRVTAPVKKLLDEFGPHLARKLVAMGLEGNPQALRICMERLMPAPRDASVAIKLPKIKSVEDVAAAAEQVIRGVGKGILSPSESARIMQVLESQVRVIESAGIEQRLQKLEEYFASIQKPFSK
jgi:hypothetical protein